jgi:hypothetical protein
MADLAAGAQLTSQLITTPSRQDLKLFEPTAIHVSGPWMVAGGGLPLKLGHFAVRPLAGGARWLALCACRPRAVSQTTSGYIAISTTGWPGSSSARPVLASSTVARA